MKKRWICLRLKLLVTRKDREPFSQAHIGKKNILKINYIVCMEGIGIVKKNLSAILIKKK